MSDLHIRPLVAEDVAHCADMHMSAFPGFFLSQLGPRFLREFYAGFVGDPEAISAVAVEPTGRIVGVLVGTLHPSGFFARLLKRRWAAFAAASVSLLLRRPLHAPRLIRAVRYRGQVPVAVSGALLSSICVDPEVQSIGAGTQLIRHFQGLVRDIGVSAYLLTDRDQNDSTNSFYRRNGWILAGTFESREGRRMTCYTYDPAEVGR